MSENSLSQDNSTKKTNKETSYNLVETIMSNPNIKNMNQSSNYINHIQISQNKNLNKSINNQANSDKSSINKGNNSPIVIMQDMKTKISNNDYNSIKELLNIHKDISQLTKNRLLNYSFSKLYTTSNSFQKRIIVELIEHGADPNHKLKFDLNEKTKSNNFYIPKNIDVTPLIYCCIKGDFELFELIKNKINLSSNEENRVDHKRNYFFYFFENNINMENKYKIAFCILLKKKENNSIKININDYDKQTGMTLLMLSVKKQNINFIKLFLENGADINLKNKIDGDTALHYAARIKNKNIIELLLENKSCDLLIKNNKNETVVDVANYNSANTEIYSLLAKKYGEQQKLLEEKKNKEKDKKNNISNGANNLKDNKVALKIKPIKKNIDELSSYIEIPFQFENNYFDQLQKDGETAASSLSNENKSNGINSYVKFKNTPILNINLKTKEDEDLLLLDNLKNENDEYDAEFEEIEKRLDKVYKEHNKLLKELHDTNKEIKSVNDNINSYSKKIKEKDHKYFVDLQKMNLQENFQKSIYDILCSQENLLNLSKNHDIFQLQEDYLNNKFDDDYFDDEQIKVNLQKDILDFQLYVKANVKMKQKPINEIRSSLQEMLESNGYDYKVYIFGSYATGLCLPWSDLDLILNSKSQNQNSKNNNTLDKLKEIQNLLIGENWINKPLLITNYPAFNYITFSTDEKHGFMKVNLTIQDKKNNGYKCAQLTKNFLNSYKYMEPLVLVIKQLLKLSNTLFSLSSHSDNRIQCLNSYSIILMVVFFIHYQIMKVKMEKVNNPEYLGDLFINFLLYYHAYDPNEEGFIFVRTGIEDSLENDDFLFLKDTQSSLVVIDPLYHKNNVLDKDIDFNSIKFFFKLILYSLRVKCDCSCHFLKDYENNKNTKYVELGEVHCILKKIFKTANRINPNLLNITK